MPDITYEGPGHVARALTRFAGGSSQELLPPARQEEERRLSAFFLVFARRHCRQAVRVPL